MLEVSDEMYEELGLILEKQNRRAYTFEEAKEIFGLAKEDILIGFFHVGIPKISPQTGKRKPVSEKVKWITT